jgi:hypothetical protein
VFLLTTTRRRALTRREAWVLFKECDGGVVGGMALSKVGQGRLPAIGGKGRVAARLEEEGDDGSCGRVVVIAGPMECCHTHNQTSSGPQASKQAGGVCVQSLCVLATTPAHSQTLHIRAHPS